MIGSPDELAANLRAVRAAIERAASRGGRDPADVTLVAVTKELPSSAVAWALSIRSTTVLISPPRERDVAHNRPRARAIDPSFAEVARLSS